LLHAPFGSKRPVCLSDNIEQIFVFKIVPDRTEPVDPHLPLAVGQTMYFDTGSDDIAPGIGLLLFSINIGLSGNPRDQFLKRTLQPGIQSVPPTLRNQQHVTMISVVGLSDGPE